MGCYKVLKFNGAHPEPPLITRGRELSVKTYILTLADSGRTMSQLRLVTPNAYVVQNEGYMKCNKKDVHTSFQDLYHANKYVCELERDNPEPVMIFEDDAELLSTSPSDYEEALRMIRQPGVDGVALGCFPHLSWKVKCDSFSLEWHRVDFGTTTHAMVLSPTGRLKLMSMNIHPWVGRFVPHDVLLYRKLTVLTPRYPLAGQLHTETTNMKAWDPTGLIKKTVFDPAKCDTSAEQCYSAFHENLERHGTLRLGLVSRWLTLQSLYLALSLRRLGQRLTPPRTTPHLPPPTTRPPTTTPLCAFWPPAPPLASLWSAPRERQFA